MQYLSENMLKVLFDPTSSGNLGARASNVRLTPDVCRLFSTNAESVQEWAGTRLTFSEPLRRKCIVFNLTRPLVLPNWSSRPDFVAGEQ